MFGRTREESHEIVVGTGVVLTALALGMFLHLRPGGAASGYELNVRLAKTDGLGKGSEVRVSGVKVGTVTDLDLDPKSYLATVRMNIRDGDQRADGFGVGSDLGRALGQSLCRNLSGQGRDHAAAGRDDHKKLWRGRRDGHDRARRAQQRPGRL